VCIILMAVTGTTQRSESAAERQRREEKELRRRQKQEDARIQSARAEAEALRAAQLARKTAEAKSAAALVALHKLQDAEAAEEERRRAAAELAEAERQRKALRKKALEQKQLSQKQRQQRINEQAKRSAAKTATAQQQQSVSSGSVPDSEEPEGRTRRRRGRRGRRGKRGSGNGAKDSSDTQLQQGALNMPSGEALEPPLFGWSNNFNSWFGGGRSTPKPQPNHNDDELLPLDDATFDFLDDDDDDDDDDEEGRDRHPRAWIGHSTAADGSVDLGFLDDYGEDLTEHKLNPQAMHWSPSTGADSMDHGISPSMRRIGSGGSLHSMGSNQSSDHEQLLAQEKATVGSNSAHGHYADMLGSPDPLNNHSEHSIW
jgi:chemotaxis protein histidine kinase CheA